MIITGIKLEAIKQKLYSKDVMANIYSKPHKVLDGWYTNILTIVDVSNKIRYKVITGTKTLFDYEYLYKILEP